LAADFDWAVRVLDQGLSDGRKPFHKSVKGHRLIRGRITPSAPAMIGDNKRPVTALGRLEIINRQLGAKGTL
jgi:hypothetical protein